MLFFANRIRETKVDELDLGLFNESDYLCGGHGFFLQVVITKSGRSMRPDRECCCTKCAKMVLIVTACLVCGFYF